MTGVSPSVLALTASVTTEYVRNNLLMFRCSSVRVISSPFVDQYPMSLKEDHVRTDTSRESPSLWLLLDAFCVTLRMRQISAEVYPVQLGPVRTAEAKATTSFLHPLPYLVTP